MCNAFKRRVFESLIRAILIRQSWNYRDAVPVTITDESALCSPTAWINDSNNSVLERPQRAAELVGRNEGRELALPPTLRSDLQLYFVTEFSDEKPVDKVRNSHIMTRNKVLV